MKSRRVPTAPPRVAWIERRLSWPLYLGGWALMGLLFVVPSIAQALAERRPIAWGEASSDFLDWLLWGFLVPPTWRLARRFPLERRRLATSLPIHLAFGLFASLAFVVAMLVKNRLLAGFDPSLAAAADVRLPAFFYGGFELFLLPYFAIVAFVHAFAYYQGQRSRELKSSRLEAQLAQAHLEMLKMQLRPHFLFNTLNAISALMHRDVDAADRMIALLSDLLRLSLEQDERHQASLRDELEFLNRYLDIEKIRFRDRLSVEIDVEPPCLQAQVPRLLLQPLVENSLRHGVAMRSAAGRVAIRARRGDERLHLEVWDDGPGMPQSGSLHEGVGLANTRARLEQLYGSDFRFEPRNAAAGGFEVLLELPFEEQPRQVAG